MLKKSAVAALVVVLSGCVFAPPKYGASGVALPDGAQYGDYLANCRVRSGLLDSCCEKWGMPTAILIGNSGGCFVWHGRQEWVRVSSFSSAIVTGRHPKALLQYVDDGMASYGGSRRGRIAQSAAADAMNYVVERFERTSNDEFAYVFRLRAKDGAAGLLAMGQVKQDIRRLVAADYAAAYGGSIGEVKVDFPEFSMKESVVEGRAEVMRIVIQSLRYDASTQKGVIAIKIGANRFEDARKWVRKNIESLAKDKNIALTTGQIPPNARFYLGAERVLDGDVLEIEFETE